MKRKRYCLPLFLLVFLRPTAAYSLMDGCLECLEEVCTSDHSHAGWLTAIMCFIGLGPPMVELCAAGELLSEPVYSFDGESHFMGLQKEIEIRLGASRKSGRSGHSIFITPVFLFEPVKPATLYLKFRMGYHYHVILSHPHGDRGFFGLTTGIGISPGGRYTKGWRGFGAAGPDLKLFYQLFQYSRVMIGTRFEYGTLGPQLDVYGGIALTF